MSKSEVLVIESIEVRELLRFLFYLDILNKLSLLQRKHSKYYRVTGNAQILEKALFPKLKLTKDLN